MNELKMYLLMNDSGYTFLQGVESDSRPIVYGKEHGSFLSRQHHFVECRKVHTYKT